MTVVVSPGLQLFVPGRLCLFGEHSDWAGALRERDGTIVPGACLVVGTQQGIRASVETAEGFSISSPSAGGPQHWPMDGTALSGAAAGGGFFSYAAGVAAEVWERYRVPGLRVAVQASDLPIRRGLSSSAAICVLVARGFNRAYELRLSVRDEMELAYKGELRTGSQCGRMDQVCAYGACPTLLSFDGTSMAVEPLRPRRALHLLVVDLCAGKDTRRILATLHAAFLGADGAGRRALRDALGARNRALVAAARRAVEDGDAAQLGALMTEAQAVFDQAVAPACPEELTAPRLHGVLGHPAARACAWGGKGVGSQGDGAAQFVCRGVEARDKLARRLTADCAVQCLPLTIRG